MNKRFTLVSWKQPLIINTGTLKRLIVLQNHNRSKDQKLSREFVENLMKEQLGHDERLVNHLIPDFALGCRRMTPGSGYLQSLTKDNVQVVTSGVAGFTENGVVDETGQEHAVDVIICSTGFDTSFAPAYDLIGRNGENLREKFGDFPKGYFSTMVDGFPNFFRKCLNSPLLTPLFPRYTTF